MRGAIIPVLALLPVSLSTPAPASSRAPLPGGALVERPECFQAEVERMHTIRGSVSMSPSGSAPPPPQAPSRSKPRPKIRLDQVAPAPDDAMMPTSMEEAAPVASADFDDPATGGELVRDGAFESKDRAGRREAGPVLDWGARIFLSNDDSMSLASAQRLLYAVSEGLRFSPSEVRPHELLNYFSFDTSSPSDAQLFDVLASAHQAGDTLEVALAVKGATPAREPLDLTLVVDRSCSMNEEGRMDYTKRGLHQMSDQLERGDRIDLVLFDQDVCTPLENFVVGRDDPAILARTIDRMRPRGSTDLNKGLHEGYAVAGRKADTHHRNRRMMLLTDAMLNTGDVDHHTVSEIGKAFEADGIRLTGIGVGRDFNDDVLDRLTEKGKGAYVYLGSEAVVDRVFGVGFASLTQTIAHDVRFALKLPDSLAMERFYGEESSTVAEDVQPINYYAGTSQVFLQDLRIRDGSIRPSDPLILEVSYRDAKTGEPEKRSFKTTLGDMLEADPHNVHKAKALMAWSDLLVADAFSADPCAEPMHRYGQAAARVEGDAEVAYVSNLVRQRCPSFEVPEALEALDRVSLKVRVDSDIPIAEVGLSCQHHSWSHALSGSKTVARFDAVAGACTLTLMGAVDMTTTVRVPSTGGDLRCMVRGGRISCT